MSSRVDALLATMDDDEPRDPDSDAIPMMVAGEGGEGGDDERTSIRDASRPLDVEDGDADMLTSERNAHEGDADMLTSERNPIGGAPLDTPPELTGEIPLPVDSDEDRFEPPRAEPPVTAAAEAEPEDVAPVEELSIEDEDVSEDLSLDDAQIEAAAPPISAPPRPPGPPPRPGTVIPPVPPPARPPLPPLARPPSKPPAMVPPRPSVAVIPPRLTSVPAVTPSGAIPVMPPPVAPAAELDVDGFAPDAAGRGTPAPPPGDVAHEGEGDAPGAEPDVMPIDVVAGATESGEAPRRARQSSAPPPRPLPGMVPSSGAPPTLHVAPHVPLEQRLETPTAIERALGDLGDAAWERRANELTASLEAVGDRERVADLAYELGELCERRLADEARAVKAFGRALASDPSLRANLWAIRRVFYRRGLWPNLVKLIDAETRFARDDVERADLLAEKAHILIEKLGQTDQGRTALEEATHLDPTALGPLYALERLALAENDRARLVDIWAQLAASSTRPERKLCYLLDQVRFWADEGNDLDRARMLLAEAAALGIDAERIAGERLRVAELAGDNEELLAALEQQAGMLLARSGPAGAPDAAMSPVTPGTPPSRGAALRLHVVALRRRQAQVARAAGDGDRAWNFLQAGLALAPGEALLLADLADLAEELGRYEELADLVQSWQSLEGDPRRALTLSIRRADALLRGGQREPALALLASLEATAPGSAPVAALRERDALTALDFAALAEVWAKNADALRTGADVGAGAPVVDNAAAIASYIAAATVWAHDVGDERGDAAARSAIERALELAPRDPIALEALVDLHERNGRVDDATAVLEAAIAAAAQASGPDASRLLSRLGRLLRSHGRLEEAIAVDQRRFALDPSDLVTGWRIDSTLDELGRDEDRLANLRVLANVEDAPARKGLALVTAARIAEVLGQGDAAIDLYRQTLAVWPDDGFSRVALRAALRRAGRWDELAAARRAEADGLADGPEVLEALIEAAWVLEDHVGDVAAAHDTYRRLLDRAPAGDPVALHARAGLARTAASPAAAVDALEALAADAEGDQVAPAAIALAIVQEQAGDGDAAAESYRRALGAAGPGAVAGTYAALALADLAQARGDTMMRVEAARALAARTTDAALAAGLHEDLGWLHALVLEDFDQAAQAFADATASNPGSPGALLGAMLVAARRGDAGALSETCARLAAHTTMPEAAAALHLRAAAMATAAGEHELALVRVAAARAIAPDDVGALLVAAEHHAVAAPPMPNEEPAAAIDRLLARADVLAMRSSLADDPTARDGWELDRAEALEAAGRLKEAGAVVAGVLRADPSDLRALSALQRLARRGGDRATAARAAVALAQRTADVETKRRLWTDAAAIFDPGLHGVPANAEEGTDAAAAIAVYRRMLVDEPGSRAFDRLRQLLRGHGDVRGLVLAISDRLRFIDSSGDRGGDAPVAAVPLLLERAQIRRSLGDRHGAAADLDDLLRRDDAHTAALRLRAEIAGELGDAPRAADLWRRYLNAEPDAGRRADAELILARILAEDMGDVGGAILQLERMIAHNPKDVALRERLVGLATRGQDWTRAGRELRELTRLRQSPGERAKDELRLGQLLRDRLHDTREARAAFERGRQLDPLNLDLLHELAELVGGERPGARAEVLGQGIEDLRGALATTPGTVAIYDRLASAFAWLGDRDGQWLALGALEALATPTAEQRQVLVAGRSRDVPPPPRHVLDAAAREALRSPGEAGVLGDIWRAATAAVTETVGVDPAKLGFGRGDRVAAKALGPRYAALANGLASLGLEAELYISEQRAGMARVLSGESAVMCLGADVAAGATPMARFLLGRALWLASSGAGTLAELKDAEVGWFLVAALRAAELPVPAPLAELVAGEDAAVAERVRLVAKHIARRDRKAIAALGPRLGEIRDPLGWRRAKIASAQRHGLLYAGDLAVALGAMDVGRGGRHISTDPAALELAAWSVSRAHLELRRARQLALPAGAPGGVR